MAYIFGDSFDLYATVTETINGYWDSGPQAVNCNLTAGRFSGSQAFLLAASSGSGALIKSGSNDALHHIFLAVQQTSAITGSSALTMINLGDGAAAQCSIVIRSDGVILLTSATWGGGTVLATYSGALTASNTWYAFEIEVFISATAGYMNVRKNGNSTNDFSSATNLNTRNGTTNNYANRIQLGAVTGGHVIDDLLWRSDATSVPWIGDVRCFTRRPASDAAVQWTPAASAVSQVPFATTLNSNVTTNQARYMPFTARATGSIGTVTVSVGTSGVTNLKCAIFTNNAGNVGVVLGAVATAINMSALGTNTFTFPTPPAVTAGAAYYVGLIGDTTAGQLAGGPTSAAVLFQTSTPYASWPVSNPTSVSSNFSSFWTTIFISPTGNPNTAQVSEAQQDGATTYVSSSTVGQSDLYSIDAISSTPASIIAVTTRGYLQKSDAGTRNTSVQLKSGGTTVQSTSAALNTVWGWQYRTDTVDPATGAAWTATGVNNAQIGVVVQS